MIAVCICLIKGIMVGLVGVGVRRVVGGRIGVGLVIIFGVVWVVVVREKVRVVIVSKEI